MPTPPRILSLLLAAWFLAVVAPAQTQTPSTQSYTYDVSTVKPTQITNGKIDMWDEDTRWRATGVSARDLLAHAFQVDPNLVVGLPASAESTRYDIVAHVSDAPRGAIDALPRAERLHMLQTLLAERFALKTHTEIRDQPCLELIVHQPADPKKPAPGLREVRSRTSAGEDVAAVRARQRVGTHLIAHRDTGISALLLDLSSTLHKPVVDHTGLKGYYDIDLTWLRGGAPPSVAEDVPSDLFTAVREQLGLELRSTRAPLPVLVVDRWAAPTEN